MLFSPTNDNTLINIYLIIIEIFIGYTAFALFFGVFANYFYEDYITYRVKNDLEKALSFYQLDTQKLESIKTTIGIIDNPKYYIDLEQIKVDKNNKILRNNFIYLIIGITFFLLSLIIIPLILGIIPVSYINLKFIGVSYLIHIIFVISFESLILFGIFGFSKTINIFRFFENY